MENWTFLKMSKNEKSFRELLKMTHETMETINFSFFRKFSKICEHNFFTVFEKSICIFLQRWHCHLLQNLQSGLKRAQDHITLSWTIFLSKNLWPCMF